MHVFTKLEFGEYVFLLLSRKIEISYKDRLIVIPMHVFTKLEFGEYVFLLLSRKIEISYKAKNPSVIQSEGTSLRRYAGTVYFISSYHLHLIFIHIHYIVYIIRLKLQLVIQELLDIKCILRIIVRR